MHGIVLKQLKEFVVATYDRETWERLQHESGVGGKVYVPVTEYPDEDVLALLETAVELTGLDQSELLSEFGTFLVAPLVETYGVHVDGNWNCLELIANVETYIHEALRAKQLSTYTPPALESAWIDDERVLVVYSSDRMLCHLAKGIIAGVGDHFGEPLTTTEETCMHDGAAQCTFVVSRSN